MLNIISCSGAEFQQSSPNIHLKVGTGGKKKKIWQKHKYPLLESKSYSNNHSAVFNSEPNQWLKQSGWLKCLAQIRFSKPLRTIAEICAVTHSQENTLTTNILLLWVISRTPTGHILLGRQWMVHQGDVRATLKTGQDAAVSNDNWKEVITKYVCPGECLLPNALVLLATF